MTPLRELHVVTHTHWDREWYHTEQRFRQRLVRLIDDLLDDPPREDESFLLDGQGILIDDYLAVRPERTAELSLLVREGRIEAGPWYVLADELIPGGEALVRNLLLGRATLRRLRGEPPPVLYCPDSFGHPSALPALARGFGCELVVLWRGCRSAQDTFEWRSPAGEAVVAYHLPPDGYEFGSSLPADAELARERWSRIEAVLAPRANTGVALLLNGADHHARQSHRAAALDALGAAASPTRLRAGSLRAASGAIVAAAREASLPSCRGELRDSYGYTWTLQGSLGSRAMQKRRAALAERGLLRDVEPWVALLPGGGDGVSRALLRDAWRTLLGAHPHDTLCGTSIDAVADAFDARLASVAEQGGGLREDALLSLAGHDRDEARAAPARWQPALLLRNAAPRERSGVVELTLRATVADVAVGPGSASRQGMPRPVAEWTVRGMPLQVISERERVELTEAPRAYPDADRIREARALGWMSGLSGYTLQLLPHAEGTVSGVPHPVVVEGSSLDNGLVRVEVSDDGKVSILDRESGRRADDVLGLTRERDVGDLYTPAIRESLDAPVVNEVRSTLRGPLRGELLLEFRYGDGSVPSMCRVALQVDAASRAVRIDVRADNREADQRLRLRLSAVENPRRACLADAAFWPATREHVDVDMAARAMEHPVATAPLHRWIMPSGTGTAALIVSDGLAEYEHAPGGVFITLLRSVGELSRADLPERPGHAGWPAPTPAAQCIGPYEARLALRLLGDVASSPPWDEIERTCDDVLLPLAGETLRSNIGLPAVFGGIELHGAGLAFSAACPSQQDGCITLRCVNRLDAPVAGEWRLARVVAWAHRARLDETPGEGCEVSGGTIRFTASPLELVTIVARV